MGTALPTTQPSAKILVVEDEHLVALDIQRRLSRMGHEPVVVFSGEAAVDSATTSHYDLVLMDIKLRGELDGIEAARTINGPADVPIIYLTAYADNTTLERARTTEPYGYVLKPFHERELKAAIEIALQRHAADRLRGEQQRMQRFLADASARMSESLDYQTVARNAAELLVPRYADWCLIHLRERRDGISAFTYARPEGEHDESTDPQSPLIQLVERTKQPEVRNEVDELSALREQLGPESASVVHSLGGHSLLCVPLRARGHVLGSLAIAAGRARSRYGEPEQIFVTDFGHRLGLALDNAMLYRKAERALTMRDDVLAIVSHDLRTPLAAIIMQAESISRHPEQRAVADRITRSAQRMNRLIGDLVDASAINAGQLTLDIGLHAAADIIHESLDMFRSQAEDRAITLDAKAPEERMRIRCDRDRLLQVFSNLIGNALKFTGQGGTVTVTAELRGRDLRFEVRDTGRGIPSGQLPHLFDRFWRAQGHRDGAGLGLFIARGIIAAHGSAIGVDSTVGIGTSFFFTLPAVTA